MKKNKAFLILVIIFLFLPFFGCFAQSCPDGSTCLDNPLATSDENPTVQSLIGKVIKAIMGLIGSIALVMFVYGGFIWMTASGNKERVQKGKDVILWSILGLVVIFSSYAIIRFVLGILEG
jgi:hypothetical protein